MTAHNLCTSSIYKSLTTRARGHRPRLQPRFDQFTHSKKSTARRSLDYPEARGGAMEAIVWLISALLAGRLARVVMKQKKSGVLGYVVLGILGGVSGAWMLNSLGGTVPNAGSPAHLA